MHYSAINEIFDAFNNKKVLIIGDIMLDAYDWGKVERISPEAPVPIINLTEREYRLGGAANVALNIQALGAIPVLCALVGKDIDGKELMNLLTSLKMTVEGIVTSEERVTTVKRRILAGYQHLLRIDNESTKFATDSEKPELLKKIKSQLSDCDVVIFEDYDKGVITPEIISTVVQWCKEQNIPVAVDPKKRNFLDYKGVTLFKPNLKELKEGLKIDFNVKDPNQLEAAVNELHSHLGSDKYLITLSERGVFIKSDLDSFHIQAHLREIADVSGAGDSVIATAALCLALGLSDQLIAQLSNLAGGLVCEHVGVVPINKQEFKIEAEILIFL